MYLVFDIGGTNTRIATSLDGQTLISTKTFPTEKDFESEIQLISQIGNELLGEQKIKAVAGGVAGLLDSEKNTLLKSPNIQSWDHWPLKEELENAFDAPVFLENDANLGGLGEACFGVGKESNIVAFITIGTGVGGVRIVDKKIDKSTEGFEPGHQIIVPNGNPCNCGGKGHLESYVSGLNIEKSYGQRAENIKDENIWKELAKYLAIGLNNTIVHWSPKVIILSGSVTQKLPIGQIELYLKENLTIFATIPPIIRGSLGEDCTLHGALELINQLEIDSE